MEFRIESPDFKKLEKIFLEMSEWDQYQMGIAALRKGTKPTEIQAQANIVHSVSGNLRKSVGTIAMKSETAVIVGARKGKGFKGWHGHLIEEGTVKRKYITKKGNVHRTGKLSAGKPYAFWLRKAVKSTEQEALTITANEMYNSIIEIHSKNGLV